MNAVARHSRRSPPGFLASKADAGVLQSVEEAERENPAGREDRMT